MATREKVRGEEEYVKNLLKFLKGIGVTGDHFSNAERKAWLGPVRRAYREVVKSAMDSRDQ